jgi:hypothetical protein
MNRAIGLSLMLLVSVSLASAADFSVQSGTGTHSTISYSTYYAGATYYPDNFGSILFRPEFDFGLWRAERQQILTSYFDYAPVGNLKSVDRGMYGGVRLAVDLEQIARRYGPPVWPAFGVGVLANWIEATPLQMRYSLFGRVSIGFTKTTAIFLEIEGHTEDFNNWFDNAEGLNAITKLGCRFRAF